MQKLNLSQEYDCPHGADTDLDEPDLLFLGKKIACRWCGGEHIAGVDVKVETIRDWREYLDLPASAEALQSLMDQESPLNGAEMELQALRKKVATYEARDALGLIPAPAHPDDVAVNEFAADLKAQLAKARAKGRSGWEDTAQVAQLDLAMELRRHLNKGDALDVAALAMMLHMRGESTKLPALSQDLVNAIKNAPAGSSVIEHGGATIFVSRDGDDGVPTIGITPPCSELQGQVISIKHLAGEIVLQLVNGAEVPQDLESGMAVDVLYTPAQEGA